MKPLVTAISYVSLPFVIGIGLIVVLIGTPICWCFLKPARDPGDG